jgi:flagellar protein FliJ
MKKGDEMSKRFPLEVVMDLTRKQANAAAAVLADLRAKERAAAATLSMLETCRRDYQQRLEKTSLTGIGNVQWVNYQEFLGKLDKAIAQQNEAVTQCRLQTQAGLDHWQEARMKLKSFDVLRERHELGEQRREAKVEQRDHDESSAAGHRQRRTEDNA